MSLKEIRTKKDFTQEQLARQLNITLRHYQYIEHRKVIPNVIIGLKLARILGVNPYVLFNIDTDSDSTE